MLEGWLSPTEFGRALSGVGCPRCDQHWVFVAEFGRRTTRLKYCPECDATWPIPETPSRLTFLQYESVAECLGEDPRMPPEIVSSGWSLDEQPSEGDRLMCSYCGRGPLQIVRFGLREVVVKRCAACLATWGVEAPISGYNHIHFYRLLRLLGEPEDAVRCEVLEEL